MLKRCFLLCVAAVLVFYGVTATAAQALLEASRVWPSPDSTRFVFDITAPVQFQHFALNNPNRIVIDIDNARMRSAVQFSPALMQKSPVRHVRVGKRKMRDLRIVFDLRRAVSAKVFMLQPNAVYGYRLVVDLNETPGKANLSQDDAVKVLKGHYRDFIVAIDAGHGGEDPGAIGVQGIREKHITLSIARKLQRLVNASSNMRAFMTRTGDYYVDLRKRMEKARKAKADLFISIHADAFRNPRAQGASVFTLSRHGASSEAAKWLAGRENESDLIGGVNLDDKEDTLKSVLLDLSQTASKQDSMQIGRNVLRNIAKVTRLHKAYVQSAAFVVLKSPDVPSILVETGFLTNPYNARRLENSFYQDKLARAIYRGIVAYFKSKPRPRSHPIFVEKKPDKIENYRIRRGDTLSTIASRHGISVDYLKSYNKLNGDRLLIGQSLKIPQPRG